MRITSVGKGHWLKKAKVLGCLISMEMHPGISGAGLHEVLQIGVVGSRIPQLEKKEPR